MTYRQLLKGNANFRHLWSGQVVSEIGDWLNNIAVLALFTLMPNLWTASLVLIAREMNFAIWWTAQQTLIMRRTDNAYAGRVFASYETLTTLMMVSSMYAAGAGADAFGLRPVAALGGLTIAFSGLLWFLLRRRNRHAATAAGDARHLST